MKASYLKSIVLITLIAASGIINLSPLTLKAQGVKVELTPLVGYQFGGSMKFIQGKFKVNNGLNYGGAISFALRHNVNLEISYSRMDTEGKWKPYTGYIIDFPETDNIGIAVNYLQFASVKELTLDNEMIKPFGLFSVGATWFQPKESGSQDEWLFSVAAGGGVKFFFNDRVGIRLQGRLLLPLIFNGAGFYFGIGSGGPSTGVGVSSTSPIVQGDFQGGLIIALGK